MERIFPHSQTSLLPRHEQREPLVARSSRSPRQFQGIGINSSGLARSSSAISHGSAQSPPTSNTSERSSSKTETRLQSAPLSSSVLHHDDPFLPVDRAARALQETIQSLLDAQSRGLLDRVDGADQDEHTSVGSLTPTQSVVTPRSSSGIRTVPIRQPVKRKVTLRAARTGLVRKMHEFAELRTEELRILDTEARAREDALGRLRDLEARREACTNEIDSINREDSSSTASKLRSEAKNVASEIDELEHRLLELRVRHRHLLDQADQIESSLESKVSSFQGTISMIDRESRSFLRRPPVTPALANASFSKDLGMYALKPERRTLEMAKEQWTQEQEVLSHRRQEVEKEQTALVEGERIWSNAVRLIGQFEQKLRAQTSLLMNKSVDSETDTQLSMHNVLRELDNTITSLEKDLSVSESNDWNLLICAIGAELEAFYQAREMLRQTQNLAQGSPPQTEADVQDNLQTGELLDIRNTDTSSSPNGSIRSNQSLKDTLEEFPVNAQVGHKVWNNQGTTAKYESEDDEPPADFLLSR